MKKYRVDHNNYVCRTKVTGLSGDTNDLPLLGIRVFNPTDLPISSADTIVRNYNWNPKAVMLLNQNTLNTAKKPQLKISYSKRIDQ